MNFYRMLDTPSGETIWQGKARDVEHAEEKCFHDDSPGSLERFTLQRWGTVKFGPTMRGKGWVTVYSNECLTSL